MATIITNIKNLVNTRDQSNLIRGKELALLPCIENAFLLVEDGIIAEYGPMYELEIKVPHLPKAIIDAGDQTILPCWCDSHTHIVYTGSRESEFVDKINGLSYAEIAAKGGGILNSSSKVNEATEDQLFNEAWQRLREINKMGTGAVEIKSGYGLTVEGELKMLRVIKKLKERSGMIIRSTFLGAHTYPLAYKMNHQGYIDQLINEMLPVIGSEGLADYIDVFCESGFFSPDEMEQVCKAGLVYGLKPKLHVNQLNSIGGIRSAIQLNSVSVDHLETMTLADINDIARSPTIATLLPTAAFFLRMAHQSARALIEAGAAIALASDYNPGSSPSGNMNMVLSLACIQLKMLPEEAINALTINGAYAMEIQDLAGSITIGKQANLIFTKSIPSIAYLPYSFGTDLIDKVMMHGSFI